MNTTKTKSTIAGVQNSSHDKVISFAAFKYIMATDSIECLKVSEADYATTVTDIYISK
jgi:hypothetical protein